MQVKYRHLRGYNVACSFISADVKVKECKPFDRRVVFSPFPRYKSHLPSTTIVIPKHHKNVGMKVPLLFEENKNVYVNSVIGVVSSVSYTYTMSPESRTSESINISKEEYICKFDHQWPE